MLTQPKSLARYQYVHNNPTTYADPDGHRIGDPSAYNTDDPDQARRMRDVDNATNYLVAENRAKTLGYEPPERPRAAGPNEENDESDRHECPAGQTMYATAYTNSSCVSDDVLKRQAENWGTFFDVLGWIGAAAGLLSLIPGMQWLAPIAMIASLASTIYNCVNWGSRLVGCIVGLVTTLIPTGGQAAGKLLAGRIEAWVSDAIIQAFKALGISADAFDVARG